MIGARCELSHNLFFCYFRKPQLSTPLHAAASQLNQGKKSKCVPLQLVSRVGIEMENSPVIVIRWGKRADFDYILLLVKHHIFSALLAPHQSFAYFPGSSELSERTA